MNEPSATDTRTADNPQQRAEPPLHPLRTSPCDAAAGITAIILVAGLLVQTASSAAPSPDPEGLAPLVTRPATNPDPEGLAPITSGPACASWGPVGQTANYSMAGRGTYRLRTRPTTGCPHDGVNYVRRGDTVTVVAEYNAWRYVHNVTTGASGWVHSAGLEASAAAARPITQPVAAPNPDPEGLAPLQTQPLPETTADPQGTVQSAPDPEGLLPLQTATEPANSPAQDVDLGPDPEGLAPLQTSANATDSCRWQNPAPGDYVENFFVQARTTYEMRTQPAGCVTDDRSLEVGDMGRVVAVVDGWLYIQNMANEKWGWIPESVSERVPSPEDSTASGSSAAGIVATGLKEAACFVNDVLGLIPSADISAYDLILTAASVVCEDGSSGLRRCSYEEGNDFSCPWANQEPYKSRIDQWLASGQATNGRSKAVADTAEALEAAYVNCLWIAGNYGPDHWALGWNHGGCVTEERQRPQ